MPIKRLFVIALKKLEIGSAVSVRLTKLTGKSKQPIHPKHFLFKEPWFTAHLNKKDTVLDLGSGNGQNALKAAKVVKKILGLELDQTLIKIARKSAKAKKNIVFKPANLEKKIDIKNNSFDKVIFLDVLEHLRKRDQILSEIHRILKREGLLLIGVPNSQTTWKKQQRSVGICSFSDPDHKIEFSESQIIALLKKNKFEPIKITYSSYDTPFRGLIDLIGGFSINLYKYLSNLRIRSAHKNPKEASGFEIVAKKK